MAQYLIQRFLIMLVMLVGLSFIVFVTIELPPGDYADRQAYRMKSTGVRVTEADIIQMRHQLGLDRPWYERYVSWIGNIVLHGNFGLSFSQHVPVSQVIGERIGFTAVLALATLIFTYGLAIPIGIFSAVRQYSF